MSETDAKIMFSELLDQVAKGEIFTITRQGKPVAELRPPDSSSAERGQKRKAGFWKGREVVIAPDFDAPLAEFREYS